MSLSQNKKWQDSLNLIFLVFSITMNFDLVNMDDIYINRWSRDKNTNIMYRHFYKYDFCNTFIDMHTQ